jgi:hypothetical protein
MQGSAREKGKWGGGASSHLPCAVLLVNVFKILLIAADRGVMLFHLHVQLSELG